MSLFALSIIQGLDERTRPAAEWRVARQQRMRVWLVVRHRRYFPPGYVGVRAFRVHPRSAMRRFRLAQPASSDQSAFVFVTCDQEKREAHPARERTARSRASLPPPPFVVDRLITELDNARPSLEPQQAPEDLRPFV